MTQNPKDAIISVNNLAVSYGQNNLALEGINLSLHRGHICGLVGVNGAGKSTLFKSLMGFIKPQSGEITIDGLPVQRALKLGRIAYVPQTENVDWNFPVRVKDVVMMGRFGHMGFMRNPKPADTKAAEDALMRVNMPEYADRQIGSLSGGQKKRVFVARALAQGGDILLLDEPFTGVDIKTEDNLIALFRSLAAEGRLIVVSTHNLGSVPSFCDEVILINRKILAHGPVETTFTQDNLAKAFGGMLRHVQLTGTDLHDDEDTRGITVLTDDERPLVLYGEAKAQKIVRKTKQVDAKK